MCSFSTKHGVGGVCRGLYSNCTVIGEAAGIVLDPTIIPQPLIHLWSFFHPMIILLYTFPTILNRLIPLSFFTLTLSHLPLCGSTITSSNPLVHSTYSMLPYIFPTAIPNSPHSFTISPCTPYIPAIFHLLITFLGSSTLISISS